MKRSLVSYSDTSDNDDDDETEEASELYTPHLVGETESQRFRALNLRYSLEFHDAVIAQVSWDVSSFMMQ